MAIGKTLTVYLAADVSKLNRGMKDADNSVSGFSKSINNLMGPALIGATAAAGAFAASLAVDGVKAAMEDEASLTKLNTTLSNLGFDQMSTSVDDFVNSLAMASGHADDQLRPALDRLVRATGDVGQAQDMLKLALDASVGSGKSLESVSNALGRGFEGSTTALGKLGLGLDQATLKSGDMNAITAAMSRTFAGQASVAAETYQGKLNRLQVAADEAKETIGYALLNAIDDLSNALGGVGGAQQMMAESSRGIGYFITAMSGLIKKIEDATGAQQQKASADKYSTETFRQYVSAIPFAGRPLAMIIEMQEKEARRAGETAGSIENLTNKYYELAAGIQAAGTALSTGDVFSAAMGGTPTGGYTESYKSNMNRLIIANNKARESLDNVKSSGGGVAKALTQEMPPAIRAAIDDVKALTAQLDDANQKLTSARQAMNSWIDSMAGQITAGINLGAAFSAQFDDAGQVTGQSLLDGFNKQIEQAGLFGSYLKTLNTEGGPELRDAVAALGPEVGNKLAKQMIDEGLVKTFQDKISTVKDSARVTAESMTPEFLTAGVNSAVAFLLGTQNALAASTAHLQALGASMGKTIGEAAAKEIADALKAAGVSSAGATANVTSTPISPMAAAEVAQSLFANSPMGFIGQPSVTSIAQSIARAISDSDQRLGRNGQAVLQ